jgi:(E)-4-hydroxy-3-methylbut-2-enyl-diphosphate synthase
MTLRGENIADEFVGVIDDYVARRYAARGEE